MKKRSFCDAEIDLLVGEVKVRKHMKAHVRTVSLCIHHAAHVSVVTLTTVRIQVSFW